MLELLQNEEEQHDMAEQNFSAALRMTMPQIIRQYVRAFDRHQRARALEAASRFRRIPAWVPSRSAIFRASRWGKLELSKTRLRLFSLWALQRLKQLCLLRATL